MVHETPRHRLALALSPPLARYSRSRSRSTPETSRSARKSRARVRATARDGQRPGSRTRSARASFCPASPASSYASSSAHRRPPARAAGASGGRDACARRASSVSLHDREASGRERATRAGREDCARPRRWLSLLAIDSRAAVEGPRSLTSSPGGGAPVSEPSTARRRCAQLTSGADAGGGGRQRCVTVCARKLSTPIFSAHGMADVARQAHVPSTVSPSRTLAVSRSRRAAASASAARASASVIMSASMSHCARGQGRRRISR